MSRNPRRIHDLKKGGTRVPLHLVSIETEEEWQFINREIQKRGTWTTGAWHIGLRRKVRFGPG